ncbi:MAG: hypothetical protein ACI4I9_08215 [Porcipelethomonas sp.]
MKKAEIFKKKNLVQIALQNGHGYVASKKKIHGYENAVIGVKDVTGKTSVFSTLNENDKLGITGYTGKPNHIEFIDTELGSKWDKLFVYLFDSDGAFFLCSDRKQLNETGMWFVPVDTYDIQELRKNVLNVAPLFDELLYDVIVRLENKEEKKLTLTDKGEL